MPSFSPAASRRIVFWIEMAFLLVLAVIGWLYLTNGMPSWLAPPASLGPMPLGVPWYGALGGVAISLTGVFEHRYDWEPRYFFWHVGRPFMGATVAVVAVLIIQAGILAAGVEPANPDGSTRNLFYYIVAFLVGYREESFRAMIKRVADVFFTSESAGSAPVVVGFDPASGPIGSEVTIRGSGFRGATVVRFGMRESPSFRINSDAEIVAEVPETEGSVAVTVVNDKGASANTATFHVTGAG
jgi:hypothetical protein